MALIEWSDGDTIAQRPFNNRSVTKGTEAELAAIPTVDVEDGSLHWNSTHKFPQVQLTAASDFRGNMTCGVLTADATEVTVVGTTPVKVKEFSYIKNPGGFNGNYLTIVAAIKTNDGGTTAHFRVRTDGGGGDDLDLTTTSTSYVVVTGIIDITGKADGIRTVEIFMDDGSGDTITHDILEVYGI